MSEYQYYEFMAVDRPLGEADRAALRALSTRARITSTSFTNEYEWGDFKGDPMELMERWFDLHLYFANWGTYRLMIRLPKQLVDRNRLDQLLQHVEWAELKASGENLILDIMCEELEREIYWSDDTEEDSGKLEALAPLRDDVLGGDLRLFYLLWLMAVQLGDVAADQPEPMPGIGPLTGALEAFADFFQIDSDLVAAAAERKGEAVAMPPTSDDIRRIIAGFSDYERTELLVRMASGDPHVASELRVLVRQRRPMPVPAVESTVAPRTAAEISARADEIRQARERAEAKREAAAKQRQAEQEARARRTRLDAIAQRGADVWKEVEVEIARRNPKGYDNAADLLLALRALADETGTVEDFSRRLTDIRERHVNKERFLERLTGLE